MENYGLCHKWIRWESLKGYTGPSDMKRSSCSWLLSVKSVKNVKNSLNPLATEVGPSPHTEPYAEESQYLGMFWTSLFLFWCGYDSGS